MHPFSYDNLIAHIACGAQRLWHCVRDTLKIVPPFLVTSLTEVNLEENCYVCMFLRCTNKDNFYRQRMAKNDTMVIQNTVTNYKDVTLGLHLLKWNAELLLSFARI